MVKVKKLVLDILKPHKPDSLAFATGVSSSLPGVCVCLKVVGVDEMTQDIVLTLTGDALVYKDIEEILDSLGASVHSIDEVVSENEIEPEAEPEL